jgi:hypothetical protein
MELDIDRNLYETLSRRADKNGFESVEEYTEVILETVIYELEQQSEQTRESITDKETVSDRLQDLGYLE